MPLVEYTGILGARISESDIQRLWSLAKFALLTAGHPLSRIPGSGPPLPVESEGDDEDGDEDGPEETP